MSEANERNKAGCDVEIVDVNGVVPSLPTDKNGSNAITNGIIKHISEVEPEESLPVDSVEQQAVESRIFLKPQVRQQSIQQ